MNLAIIPARGGSKRIPRKNIKYFLGKPIIAYSIEAAIESKLFDEIMVSTDDVEIAEIALKYGAKVPFYRSENNSDDFATTTDVLLEVIEKYKENGNEFKNICCIYPSAPFVKDSTLNEAFSIFESNDFDCIFPVMPYSFPIQRALGLNHDKIHFLTPEYQNSRSQDLEKSYHDAGQFYWGKALAWESGLPIFSSSSTILEMPRDLIVDIDTLEDWHHAERLFESSIRE